MTETPFEQVVIAEHTRTDHAFVSERETRLRLFSPHPASRTSRAVETLHSYPNLAWLSFAVKFAVGTFG